MGQNVNMLMGAVAGVIPLQVGLCFALHQVISGRRCDNRTRPSCAGELHTELRDECSTVKRHSC